MPPSPSTTTWWHGGPMTQHGHNHHHQWPPSSDMAGLQHNTATTTPPVSSQCHLGLGMFFFSLLFYFTNKFIFYLLMMPRWCPTGTIASTTTTIMWHDTATMTNGPMPWPTTWHSHNTACPVRLATWHNDDDHTVIVSSVQTTHFLGFGMFFFVAFPFLLFY